MTSEGWEGRYRTSRAEGSPRIPGQRGQGGKGRVPASILCTEQGPTHPLLSITVLQVIDGAVVPVQPDAHQVAWQEAILCQNDKVGEEASQGLDHSCRRGEVKRGVAGAGGPPEVLLSEHLWAFRDHGKCRLVVGTPVGPLWLAS